MSNENSICKRAAELWGVEPQIRMLQEESTELSLAAGKMCRHFRSKDAHIRFLNLAEEIADVEIMIEQMHIFFPHLQELISAQKLRKLNRLEERIMAYKKEIKDEN